MAGLEDASPWQILKKLRIIGGGWAGLSAAISAVQRGWQVRIQEAAPSLGGRARRIQHTGLHLDNGQHILIGAYTKTLQLLKLIGVKEQQVLMRLPLHIITPQGFQFKALNWPSPLHVLTAIATAKQWSIQDKFSLFKTCVDWQIKQFKCDPSLTVQQICKTLSPSVYQSMIEPLCIAALNTPASQASASVFLRVLQDAFLSGTHGSDFLLPRVDLSELFVIPAQKWLIQHGAVIECHQPVESIKSSQHNDEINILACPPWEAARLTQHMHPHWSLTTSQLQFEAIATVYTHSKSFSLSHPFLALPIHHPTQAQFVFDQGRISQHPNKKGLWSWVVSASQGDRDAITQSVLHQARDLGFSDLDVITTVVEKRASFSCKPGISRPPSHVGQGLWACGDYIDGPYPSTLEGAVLSGQQVIDQIGQI
ncbi:MAG: FAD-binding protein [Limnohabitans sp.]|nr:FAD-binding protein [Limnohabitans sp.]